MLMKIGKITTLLCLLAAGTLTSVAQLSWVYEGKTLAEGETITIADNMDNLSAGKYIHIANSSESAISATVTKNVSENDGFMTMMCVEQNCLPDSQTSTPEFTVPANGTYDDFHIQVIPTSAPEGGEAHVTFTVNGGGSSATVNVVFVLDNTGGVNDVAGDGNGYGIAYASDVLTVSGATAGQQVRVVDITGRVAASMPVDGDGVQRYDLNLGRGIYLVAVQEAGRTVAVQKVIVR